MRNFKLPQMVVSVTKEFIKFGEINEDCSLNLGSNKTPIKTHTF